MANDKFKQTKAEVGAHQECIDLCDNGYLLVSRGMALNGSYYILRHHSNGRKLSIFVEGDGYVVKENGTMIKAVGYVNP